MRNYFVFVLLCLTATTWAQKKKPAASTDKYAGVEAELQQVLKDWHAAGFAVAVVEKNKVVFSKGFGVRDLDTKQPVTPNTLFAIGSCTKAFTSTLVGQLVADGKFTYDEPVRNYLPELKFFNNDMNNSITMRDMMSHRTGLPRHDLSWYLNPSDNRDSLLQRIQFMEPTYRPKEKYQYNNFMFFAQGYVVEKFSRQSWEKNMLDKIFKPLGMTRSNMPYSAVKADSNLASPYSYSTDSTIKKVPHYNIGGMGPAGAVYSSVLDMSKWVQAWIYGGKYNGQTVVPAVHFKEATSGQMTTGAGIPEQDVAFMSGGDYGFGWTLSSYRGHYQVEHGGAIDGFIATTAFFPNDSIGIVVLSNQDSRTVPAIVRRILIDRALGLSPIDWNKRNLDAVAKAKAATAAAGANTKPVTVRSAQRMSHSLAAYEGLYTHPAYGTYDVFVQHDSLWLRTSRNTYWLNNWHYDFFYPVEIIAGEKIDTSAQGGQSFRFNTNISGDIESLQAFGFEAPNIQLVFSKAAKAKALSTADLEQYTGSYQLGNMLAKVYIKNENTLYVEVPGQPPYELAFTGEHKFVFKAVAGFALQFEAPVAGKAPAVTFLQPHGNYKANRQ